MLHLSGHAGFAFRWLMQKLLQFPRADPDALKAALVAEENGYTGFKLHPVRLLIASLW